MLDLNHDAACIRLNRRIADYADAVRTRQINKAHYLKNFGSPFDCNERFPYPYDDDAERHLFNAIDAYLLRFDEHERAEANGHFLRQYQTYLTHPFAKHARELAIFSIKNHPLQDEDKINFLEYLLSSGKYVDFDKKTLFKLADYNPSFYLQRTNRLYNRAFAKLLRSSKDQQGQVDLLYGMLNNFADRVETLSSEAAVNYAELYFKLSDVSAKPLSPWLLGKLALKASQTPSEGENCKKALDKNVMNLIFASYVKHVIHSKNFNENLETSMFELARAALENCDYTPKEAGSLLDTFKVRNNKKRSQSNREKEERLENLARRLSVVPINPFAGVNVDDSSFKVTDANVLAYAEYLFKFAAYHTDQHVETDTLMHLLKRNASLKRLDIVEASLFSEARKIQAVDKALVLKVADAYASSVHYNDACYGDLNFDFGRRMSEMFKDVVSNYNYNGRDVRKLANVLATGCDNDPYFKEMGDAVFKSYTLAQRRRSRALSKQGKGL